MKGFAWEMVFEIYGLLETYKKDDSDANNIDNGFTDGSIFLV